MAQWATFLRNHDELDLSRLTDEQRRDVFAEFAPKTVDAALRPRHPPPTGPDDDGDRRHIELAYALQFAMPGTPVIRYGEEIGMARTSTLPGRDTIRTPMQWDDGPNGGFVRPILSDLVGPVRMSGLTGLGGQRPRPTARSGIAAPLVRSS